MKKEKLSEIKKKKLKEAYEALDSCEYGSEEYKRLTESINNLEKTKTVWDTVLDWAAKVGIPIITIAGTIIYSGWERNEIYKNHARNNFITDSEERGIVNDDSRKARGLIGKRLF